MYYLLYAIFYLFSLLPMWLLYGIADIIYGIVYHLLGYRKKVVRQNLATAFPEKTAEQRRAIEKKFYRNMIDAVVETFKMLSASRKFLQKRVTANWELLKPLEESGRSCQVHLGHTFNWEWGQNVLQMHSAFQVLVVYGPLNNKAFERLLLKMRTRFGSIFIPSTNMKNEIVKYKNTQHLLGLVADQSPGSPTKAYWLHFLNQPTAFIIGPENGAKKNHLPVVFSSVNKTKRGYYDATFSIATETPQLLAEGELTKMYVTFLEAAIKERPENWLWSHRRWKHAYKPEYASQWIGDDKPPGE